MNVRGQGAFIVGIIAAIIIAVFAVINVDAVPVNYVFGTANWPLILVILGSVFLGAAVAGAMGMIRVMKLQSEVKRLKSSSSIKDPSQPSTTTNHTRSDKHSKTPAQNTSKP